MKNLISTIILAVTVSVLLAACTGQSRTDNAVQQRQPVEDSIVATVPQIVRGRVVEDTAIGRWTIKALKDSNDVTVGRHDWAVKDSSVFLTLSYDNKVVYSGKEIRTKDLVGNEGEYMMQWGGIDVYMGVDGFYVVADFMALYLNERAVGASPADVKRLYGQYCTKELTEELSAATFPIISDDTDFRHAYKTIQIEPQDGFTGLPLEKYSFEVKFKPKPNDENVTDILYMEVDGSTNKIIKIDSGEREVI